MKYIENEVSNGIVYDWRKVMKVYNSLGVPSEWDYSEILPLEKNYKWHVLVSSKSTGKTTSVLLIGLILNALYGVSIQLCRHHMDNGAYYDSLFSTINLYNGGQYLERIYHKKNLFIGYHARFFHLYQLNEDTGKKEKVSTEPIAVALANDECYTLCGRYDAPKGDWIILDECFTDTNKPDEFQNFINLHKTITRERMSDKIFVLGNTYDANNIWFRQLTISRDVRKMKAGDSRVFHTVEGMPIYVHYLTPRSPEKRKRFNKMHYGFNNPELNAITGEGAWNSKLYPLYTSLPNRKTLVRGLYFRVFDDTYLECEYVKSDLGEYFFFHPCRISSAQNSKLIYTNIRPSVENEMLYGHDRLSVKINDFIIKKRIVFSDNETGNLFETFLNGLK